MAIIQTLGPGDLNVQGAVNCQTLNVSAACIGNGALLSGLDGSKISHENVGPGVMKEIFDPLTTIIAATKLLFVAQNSGTLLGSLKAFCTTVATGADRTVSIDLQKSTGGGAFASVLTTSPTQILTNGSTVRTQVTVAIATPSYVAGDIFQLVVTVAGSAGAQALGLGVSLQTKESPN